MADIAITAANVLKSSAGSTATGTAGATITAGQCLYIDTGDSNKLKLADADGTSPANTVAGIALHAALSGQPITYVTADTGFTFGGTGTIATGALYLSDTPGGITQTIADLEAGDKVISLGVLTSTTVLNLRVVTGGTI